MKRIKIIFLLLLVLTNLQAQFSTEGKDFYLSFMGYSEESTIFQSSTDTLELFVLVASKVDSKGYVENIQTGYRQNFTVKANNVEKIIVPESEFYCSSLEDTVAVFKRGLHLYAEDNVSVYLGNYRQYSFDAAAVLPYEALGTDYKIATYHSSNESCYQVIATEDNTEIEVVFPNIVEYNGVRYEEDTPYTFTLNRGEVFLVASQGMIGSTVKSKNCKKISVLSGNYCPFVPNNCYACDVLVEPVPPTATWGTQFLINPTLEREADSRVVAIPLKENTALTIHKNGNKQTLTFSPGQYVEIELNKQGIALSADKPISVTQYAIGSSCSGKGDPFMIWINPIEQNVTSTIFAACPGEQISEHYVQIFVPTAAIDETLLDGEKIDTAFHVFPEMEEYSVARLPISANVHTLSNPEGLMAYVYGYADGVEQTYESYGYYAGTAARNVEDYFSLTDSLGTQSMFYFNSNPEDNRYAISDTIGITHHIAKEFFAVNWLINNGEYKPEGNKDVPDFSWRLPITALSIGENTISMLIVRDCKVDTFTAKVWVTEPITQIDIEKTDTICEGENSYLSAKSNINGIFYWGNLTTGEIIKGKYATVAPTKSTKYKVWCDYKGFKTSYDTLSVIVIPKTYDEISEQTCEGKGVAFGDDIYYKSGDYKKYFTGSNGCDSIATLHLNVLPNSIANQSITLLWGDTATVGEHHYTVGGDYTDVFTAANGCDSIIHTHIRMSYTNCPPIEIPAFFSPDGDGINDFWTIENIDCYPDAEIRIYDRNGTNLAELKQGDTGWDGIYLGKPCVADTYWYEIRLPKAKKEYVGPILLKR